MTTLLYAPSLLSTDVEFLFLAIFVLCPTSILGSLTLFAAAFVLRKDNVAGTLIANAMIISVVPLMMFLMPAEVKKDMIDLEDQVCWCLFSREYKTALELQTPARNELNHVHWRSWGALDRGQSWLVFDPSGQLSKFKGHDGLVPKIPCPVYDMKILSKHYVVVDGAFEASWDDCPDAARR